MRHQLLTHSRMLSFKMCRQRHWFEYEAGMRKNEDSKALRMGSAYHDALEMIANRHPLSDALEVIYKRYDFLPEEYDRLEWEYERETLVRLVCAYVWRWEHDQFDHLVAEQSFVLPLISKDTGRALRTFRLAGKIDGIVRLQDGRMAVLEHKLLGEDLEEDSNLWRRLRVDHQISLYCLAARRLGYPVECVMYNVTRKPTIKPTKVPLVDEDGIKIVTDAEGRRVANGKGGWRQTASTENGWVLQTRDMTPTEWGQKLADDIQSRPQFYFQRREIARLDVDLERFEEELLDIAQTMRDAQLRQRWYRTSTKDTCAFCSFFGPCTSGWRDGDAPPEGFSFVSDIHPELGVSNEHTATAENETDASAADEIAF